MPRPSPPLHKGGGAPSPIFGPFLLWPNGWMHQDANGGRPLPRGICVRWRPSPPPKKEAEPPNFQPVYCGQTAGCWMDQDGTWQRGRPWSSPHCARWRHSSLPKKGAEPTAPQFSAHLYCGQTAVWNKMPFSTKVGLNQGDFVLD